jgi:hypothetical protein
MTAETNLLGTTWFDNAISTISFRKFARAT